MLIVRTATKLEILRGRGAALCKRHQVVIFEEACLQTAPLRADEGAPAAIPLPDGSPDGRWHVPRSM
jgi:hypothetical protein